MNESDILIMDLDGTLIRSDTTYEMLVLCARWLPLSLPLALFKLLCSRAEGKRWLADRVGHHIDPNFLPYDENALDLIKEHNAHGGKTWLISGAEHNLVARIANHLGLFERFQGTDSSTNLTATRKADYLDENCPSGYYYAGNSNEDLAVWRRSIGGFGFRAPVRAYQLTADDGAPIPIENIVPRTFGLRSMLKTIRLHQWAKNILVFVVPGLLLTALTIEHWLMLLQGFICFGMMASGTYLLNDLFDIPDDRKHPTKKNRQIAAANVSIPLAVTMMSILVSGSLIWATLLHEGFAIILSLYAVTTVCYSFRLKRLPIVDVFLLAGLFSIRVWAGAELVDAPPTAWLMTFIGLTFLSLALAKRYVEVSDLRGSQKVSGRGYRADDGPTLLAFGAATAYSSVLALAIYGLLAPNRLIDDVSTLMILASIIAAWFLRIWLVAGRGELNDDPVLYAVKDRVSLACLILALGVVGMEETRAIWGKWF